MAECPSSSSAGGGAAEKSWSCSLCTFFNYERSKRCTMCLNPRDRPLLIEEEEEGAAPAAIRDYEQQEESSGDDEEKRWPCPSCTFHNFIYTPKCTQCLTDRPLRYGSDTSLNKRRKSADISPKQSTSSSIAAAAVAPKALINKWKCPTCTYLNWPASKRCTMCGSRKEEDGAVSSLSQRIDDALTIVQPSLRSEIQGSRHLPDRPAATPLELYIRRFVASDPREKQFFRAAASIGGRDMAMTNGVVDYIIQEGNTKRQLSSFEARLLAPRSALLSPNRQVAVFERGDTLLTLAKKCDFPDLLKLLRRVMPQADQLPCAANCSSRNRVYAKVAQSMAIREGVNFSAQFLPHPYTFSIFKLPMSPTDLNLKIMKALLKPAPGIPPSWMFLDCLDVAVGSGGAEAGEGVLRNVVGRPANFLLNNRGGAHSLCDAVFQAMFGLCDRFNLLNSALKYTLLRSSHLFKARWRDQYLRMARDCGLAMSEEDCETDWDELISATINNEECLEPLHVWVLAHVVRRPIVVVPMDDPLGVDDIHHVEVRVKARQQFSHICEGIYLPLLWTPSQSVSRSPLVLAFSNGLYYASIISDNSYHPQKEVQRLLRLQRSRRYGDNLFRFLSVGELENASLVGHFLSLGPFSSEAIIIRRDAHPFLYETLHFYGSWVNAMQCEEPIRLEGTIVGMERCAGQGGGGACFDKLSIFNARAAGVLNATMSPLPSQQQQGMHGAPESSKAGAPHLDDSEGEEGEYEEEEEDNESLVDGAA